MTAAVKRINKKYPVDNMDVLEGAFDDYHKMFLDINGLAESCEPDLEFKSKSADILLEIAFRSGIIIATLAILCVLWASSYNVASAVVWVTGLILAGFVKWSAYQAMFANFMKTIRNMRAVIYFLKKI